MTITKGYYCVSSDVSIEIGLQYCKAGGDEGMTFGEALGHANEIPGTRVVDKDGKICYCSKKSN